MRQKTQTMAQSVKNALHHRIQTDQQVDVGVGVLAKERTAKVGAAKTILAALTCLGGVAKSSYSLR